MLSIIIPTFNREKGILRLLEYYINKSNFKIIILDSSEIKYTSVEFKSFVKNSRVTYFHFDKKILLVEKIIKGLKAVNTKYVVLCADDDITSINALKVCTHFLEKNKKYIGAHGKYFHHNSYKDIRNHGFTLNQQYKNSGSIESFEEYECENRFLNYINSNGTLPFYAVFEAKIFDKIWNRCASITKDFFFSEITFCSFAVILGNIKKLSIGYSLRFPNENTVSLNKQDFKKIFDTNKINFFFIKLIKNIEVKNLKTFKVIFYNYMNSKLKKLNKLHQEKEKFKNKQKNHYTILKKLKNFIITWYVCIKYFKFSEFLILKNLILRYDISSAVMTSRKKYKVN
tara:strand:- start:12528 stop:13553 length:1026 start_codon:yes stop_codon:yes gene_type:complete